MPRVCYYILLGVLTLIFLKYIHDVYIRRTENFEIAVFPSSLEDCKCPRGYVAAQETTVPIPDLIIYRVDLGFQGMGIFLYGYPGEKELYTVHNDMGGDPAACCYYIEKGLVDALNVNTASKGGTPIDTTSTNAATDCTGLQDPAKCSAFLNKNVESYVKLFEHSNGIYEKAGFLPSNYYNYITEQLAKKGFIWLKDISAPDKGSPFYNRNLNPTSKKLIICKDKINPTNTVSCAGTEPPPET